MGLPDKRAAGTASRPAYGRDARCVRPLAAAAVPLIIHLSPGAWTSVASAKTTPIVATHGSERRGSAPTPASISAVDSSTTNSSPVNVHRASIASCIRRCASAVPSPRRITQSALARVIVAPSPPSRRFRRRLVRRSRERPRSSKCACVDTSCRAIVAAKSSFGRSTSWTLRNAPPSRRKRAGPRCAPAAHPGFDSPARLSHSDLAKQVEADIRQRDVLFQHRPAANHSPSRWPSTTAVSARRSMYSKVRVGGSSAASQIFHFLGHRKEGRVSVDFRIRGSNNGTLSPGLGDDVSWLAPPRSTRLHCAACRHRGRS